MTLPDEKDGSIDRLTHGTLPERVYGHLRDMIVRGRIAPSTRVLEGNVSLRYGVSRTPVREAMARLLQEGFLTPLTGGRRTELVVAPLSVDSVRELWSLIGALEGHAVRSIDNLTESERLSLATDLEDLNIKLCRASSARPRDPDRLFELQAAFHQRFIDETAGPRLLNIYATLRPQVQRYEWAYGTRLDAEYEPSSREHLRIISAIKSGDGAKARDAVETHWKRAAERTVAIIDQIVSRPAPRRKERSRSPSRKHST